MLDYYKTEAAVSYAKHGPKARLLGRPIDPALLDKWKTAMPARNKASIIGQAGALLCHLGYETPTLPRSQQRELAQIQHILNDEPGESLDLASTRLEPAKISETRLKAIKYGQFWHFMQRDYRRWAASGIRWQQGVARLMQ
ncbi:MAG: hypothetical protein ACOY99_10630 [Pseudomonadota bacterium]